MRNNILSKGSSLRSPLLVAHAQQHYAIPQRYVLYNNMLALTASSLLRQLSALHGVTAHAACTLLTPPDRDGSATASTSSVMTSPCSQLTFTRGMAFKKAGGTARQKGDGTSRNLGVKFLGKEIVFPGQIIVRQRGTKWHPGSGVGMGKDHTIFATSVGLVNFSQQHIVYPNKLTKTRTVVNVVPVNGDTSPAYKELEAEMIARRALIKRQMLKPHAHEAALHFPLPQRTQRTLPISFPPPSSQPAAPAASKSKSARASASQ